MDLICCYIYRFCTEIKFLQVELLSYILQDMFEARWMRGVVVSNIFFYLKKLAPLSRYCTDKLYMVH